MKFTSTLVLMFTCTAIFAQQAEGPRTYQKNVIKFNTLSALGGTVDLNYERKLSNAASVQVGGAYTFRYLDEDVTGFQVNTGLRLYPAQKRHTAPRGWYLGPTFAYARAKNRETKTYTNGFATGIAAGYQWVWKSNITLDLGLNPQYTVADGPMTREDLFLVGATVSLGYNF